MLYPYEDKPVSYLSTLLGVERVLDVKYIRERKSLKRPPRS